MLYILKLLSVQNEDLKINGRAITDLPFIFEHCYLRHDQLWSTIGADKSVTTGKAGGLGM
jgi:hypothetical protein